MAKGDISEAELEGLQLGVVPDTIPDPSPEVVARAKKLLASGEKSSVESGVEITDQDKVAFVAHVIDNATFEKTYQMLDGRLTVTFRYPSTEEIESVGEYVLAEEKNGAPKETRAARRASYLGALSIAKLRIDGILPKLLDTSLSLSLAYSDYCNSMSAGRLQLLEDAYSKFIKLYDTLLQLAGRPDFFVGA